MEMIKHKAHGEGKVISKRVQGNDVYITVLFEDGHEGHLSAKTFASGVATADGALKEEIDALLLAQAEELEALKRSARVTTPAPVAPTKVVRVKTSSSGKKRWIPPCSLAAGYEKYLIDHKYKIESDSGNPSTVYSYGNAVENVIEREHLTWDSLATNIDDVVEKYDQGGICQAYGEKSNKTYINALKRFQEFVSAL